MLKFDTDMTVMYRSVKMRRHDSAMFDKEEMKMVQKERERWEQTTLPNWLKQSKERKTEFRNYSGLLIKRLYTPEDIEKMDYLRDIGFPGE